MRIDRHAKWSLCWTVGLLCLTAASGAAEIKGRFVRIEMPTPGHHYMDLSEIEVFSGPKNVALQGKASALSQRAHPNIVLDGDTSGDKVHSARRAEELHWLEIDLGQSHAIDRIVVWPRKGLVARLDGFLLTILDDERRVTWHQRVLWAKAIGTELTVTPFAGRYVGAVVPVGAKGWYDLGAERRQDYQVTRPIHELELQPPPDAARRREIFEGRDSDTAVEDLYRRFAAALTPTAPGLETFRTLYERGDYRGALDAYRAFFFAKEMEHVALPALNPYAIDALRRHVRISMGRDSITEGSIGAPGATIWAPYGIELPPGVFFGRNTNINDLFWRTPEAKRIREQIAFFTEAHGPTFANFDDLLTSYAASGDRGSLTLWMDYLDDWCLFGLEDIHASPLGLVWATELGSYSTLTRLRLLRSLATVRPEFATHVRSTTLARYVLTLIESLPPYTIRAKRTELANWGIIATTPLLTLHKEMPEFIAVNDYRNEAWRLWQSEWIHRNAPDGTGAEATEGPYRYVALGHFPLGYELPWAGTLGEMQWREIVDHARVILRQALGETAQTGHGFMHRDNFAWRDRKDPFFDETETWARMEVFEGRNTPTSPSVLSEMTAYGGKYILRENWKPDGEFFYMANFRFGSQNPQLRTFYCLINGNEALPGSGAGIHYEASPLYGYPLLVDRRGPHPKHGITPGVGGKTDYLDRAGTRVVDTRFHTSSRFDLAEAKQNAPYALRNDYWAHYWMPHAPQNSFVWGPHTAALARKNDEVVKDVVTWRQVFSVRGENLYIVSDRIESERNHEYASCFYLNLPGDAERLKSLQVAGATLVRTDPTALQVRTTVPGQRNLSLRFFGSMPFSFFNRFDRNGEHETFASSTKPDLKAYPLGVHGQGHGNQVLIAVHNTLPVAGDAADAASADLQDVRKLDGAAGVTGFSATTRNGTPVWYQTGPQRTNALQAGPVSATAESLLVVQRNGELSGLALGCAALTLSGEQIAIPQPDFEFVLKPDTRNLKPLFAPIHRPIDTVRILPSQNVFTDSVQVSFDIPTQNTAGIEFRYTLDGSDPSIESALYAKPFRLTETTLVKVRAFREGLKTTPYRQCGTDSSSIFHALFTREAFRPAVTADDTVPGLNYAYYENRIWPRLFAHAGVDGVLDVTDRGTVGKLLDAEDVASIRQTDGPYAIIYQGFIDVPKNGVYTFHAPPHLYDVTADAGFDLRVFVDGEEWRPTPRLHAENTWYVPLLSGKHRFEVRFVDFRHKTWRNEWWMNGHKEIVWQGIPILEIDEPGLQRQPIPASWLRH